MAFKRDIEGFCHAGGGDVIMCRADSATGKEQVEPGPAVIDGGNDMFRYVGDHPDLHKPDTSAIECLGKHADIGILCTSGKDFVTNDKKTCRAGSHEPVITL